MSDSVWVDVLPSMRGFGADLVRGTRKAATDAGREAGRGYSKAFDDSSRNAAANRVKELERAQRQATGLVQKLSGDVSRARQSQSSATANLITQEAKLAQTVQKYGENSSQAEAQTHKVEAAKERATRATKDYERAENALREGQRALTSTTEELEESQKELTGEVKKGPGVWGKLQDAMDHADGTMKKTGKGFERLKKLASTAAKGIAIGVTAIGGAIAGIGAVAIKGGLERSLNIEDARASLMGLGNDAKTVDTIMENALASVKGTAFGLGDAATIAATAVAAGITPGKELERTLTLTANAAAIARTGLDEMGSILNKVWTNGRVQTDELNQIADRGIPIWTALAEHYNVNGTELRKMVSAGKVDAADFADVLENTVGDAAKAMGDTTRGSWDNMMAALSRGGESFLSGVFPYFREGLQGITGYIDKIEPAAARMGEAVGKWFTGTAIPALQDFTGWIKQEGIPRLQDLARWVGENIVPKLRDLGDLFTQQIVPRLQDFGGYLVGTVVPAIKDFGAWLVRNKDWLLALGLAIGVGVGAWQLWMGTLRTIKTVTDTARAAQVLFNTALTKNPIGLVIAAVAALAAGLVFFFTKTETGRQLWETFTGALKGGWDWVTNAISSGWDNYIRPTFDAVGAAATFLWEKGIQPVVGAIRDGWNWMVSGISSIWNRTLKPVLEGVGWMVWWMWDTYIRVVWHLIKTGWEGVTTGVKYAWEKWLKPAFQAAGDAAKFLWEKAAKPAWNLMKAGWDLLVGGIKSAWDNILKPAFDAVGNVIKWLWEKTAKPVWDLMRGGWDSMVGGMTRIWNEKLKPMFDRLSRVIKTDVPGAFNTGKDAIGRAWNAMKNLAAAPINFVIGTVYNEGLRKAINKVVGVVGGTQLPALAKIPAYARGGFHEGGWALVGEEGPELVNFGAPGRVYTAQDTKQIMQGAMEAPAAALPALAGATESEARIPAGNNLFGRAASAVKDAWSKATGWVRGGLAKAAGMVLNPVKDMVLSAVPSSNTIGQIVRNAATKAVDSALNWIRGKDDEAMADGTAVYQGALGAFHRPSAGPITSRYGPRWGAFHAGVDIAGGGPTRAALPGVVQRVGWNVVPGRTGIGILLNHAKDFWTYYGHNPVGGVRVKPGDEVKAGQHIGAQGATGNVTGVHLHFETQKGRVGNAVNPAQYMKYDSGGILQPGFTLAYNGTGKPETIRTAEQEAALHGQTVLADESIEKLANEIADKLGVLGESHRQVTRAVSMSRVSERMG